MIKTLFVRLYFLIMKVFNTKIVKKKYTKPTIKIETFTPQQYVAACSFYRFKCDTKGYLYTNEKGIGSSYDIKADNCGQEFIVPNEDLVSKVNRYVFKECGKSNNKGLDYIGKAYKIEIKVNSLGNVTTHTTTEDPLITTTNAS